MIAHLLFFSLLCLFYESGLVSQEQEILLGILVQEDIIWELVSDLLEVSRSKREGILPWDQEAANTGAWSSEPTLPLYWKSYHCPCPNEGPCTGVSGVLSCLSHSLQLQPPANASHWQKLIGTRLLREAGKCLLAQSSRQSREGRCAAKRLRFSKSIPTHCL